NRIAKRAVQNIANEFICAGFEGSAGHHHRDGHVAHHSVEPRTERRVDVLLLNRMGLSGGGNRDQQMVYRKSGLEAQGCAKSDISDSRHRAALVHEADVFAYRTRIVDPSRGMALAWEREGDFL